MMTPFALVHENVVLGKDVRLTGFCNLYGCEIGDECLIGPFVEIQSGVRLGRRVKVQSHAFVCSGVCLEDEVFVSHGVMFINDRFPRATTPAGQVKRGSDWMCEPTVVGRRAAIGSNATVLCGVTIGEGAIVGAGSVVTRDVPAFTVVAGNPARVLRRVRPEDEQGGRSLTVAAAGVPFLDLPRQHAHLKQELLAVVEQALDSAGFVGGPMVEQFEEDYARFCGSRYCVGVSSGTDALRFALLAVGVGPGTSVITVPNSFVATAAAITQAGAAVEFVDVDPDTCLMDPAALEEHLKRRLATPGSGPRPAAVVPVHLYGQCADMEAILTVARRHGLKVVEDAAQAHGSRHHSRPAGSLGDAAAFSFYPGKNLGACGEAGAVTTDDPDVRRQVLLLRDHGRSDKYLHVREGYNGRLDAIQAGLLSVKLRHLEEWNERRRQRAAEYDIGLAALPALRRIVVRPENTSSHHLYVVRSARRDALQAFLRERGIATGVHYPVALHLQPCYARLGLGPGSFLQAERSCSEVVSLPIFPEMEPDQVRQVLAALGAFHQAGALRKAG
jgi:dTDP-4-amino-4,6-dideoxygalactose transaminase/acetyltransferase-like isoleucine patch superfamily enzyme